MKKWFKKTVAVVLTAAVALTVGTPVFAAENVTDVNTTSNNEKFYITETTTWGDVIRYRDLNDYMALPAEMKEQVDSVYVKESENQENHFTPRDTIAWIGSFKPTWQTSNNSFSYSIALSASQKCPYLFLEVIIYDHNTGELMGSSSGSEYNASYVIVSDEVAGLKSNYPYRFATMGDVLAPAGEVDLAPMYGSHIFYTGN